HLPPLCPTGPRAATLTNGVLVPTYTRPTGQWIDMTDDGFTKADAPKRVPEAGEDVAARLAALETELEKAREEARQHHERWLRERAELEQLKTLASCARRERRARAELGDRGAPAGLPAAGTFAPSRAGERGKGARPEPCQGQGP